MTKLLVVEARRLLPIVVLFVMLVLVSVYDGLISQTNPVLTQPNSIPYRTLIDSAQSGAMQSRVVTDLEMWVAMHSALGLNLSDHDFKPELEVAVFLLNCQLHSTKEIGGTIELAVSPRKHTFQLVLFNKSHLVAQDQEPQFVLVELAKGN